MLNTYTYQFMNVNEKESYRNFKSNRRVCSVIRPISENSLLGAYLHAVSNAYSLNSFCKKLGESATIE